MEKPYAKLKTSVGALLSSSPQNVKNMVRLETFQNKTEHCS